jgi:hypothetical protein
VRSGAIGSGDDAGHIAGYAKAAHLKGTVGANKLFLDGVATHDANGTSTATYAKQASAAMNNLAPAVEVKLRGA